MSRLEDENEAHIFPANDPKLQEDIKMYIRLPDYDASQGYDLGVGGV